MSWKKIDDLGRIVKLYRPQIISQIFYAVLLAPLQSERSISLQLRSALLANTSSFDRVMSLVNLIDRITPGFANALSHWFYKKNRFPWTLVDTELMAAGSGAAVFKLNGRNGTKVLRLYRKSLGKLSPGLVEMAAYYKKNYETILSWYGSAKDLVLPMQFLVLQGLPLIGPVAASLQPYVHGQHRDLFEDYSDDELLRILAANREVREQFLVFVRQTICQWEEGKMCYDFIGRENLMLVKQGTSYKLQLVDVGIFKFDGSMKIPPEKVAKIEQRIRRMAAIYELAKDY